MTLNLTIIKTLLKKYIPQFDFTTSTNDQIIDCAYCCMIDGGYVSTTDLLTLQNAGIDINYFKSA